MGMNRFMPSISEEMKVSLIGERTQETNASNNTWGSWVIPRRIID